MGEFGLSNKMCQFMSAAEADLSGLEATGL